MWARRTWICALLVGLHWTVAAAQNDPLPSWNKGTTVRDRITAFVQTVTDQERKDYVAPEARIAVFDNDGTLWSEQPMYVQMAFMLDRVKTLTPQHPEWRDKQPYKAVLDHDVKALAAQGEKGVVELMAATHTGMSSDEFNRIASDWIAQARHPKYDRPYTETVYQPMLELLAYLRANGFKTYIVSGGGIDFMRPWTEKVYGIPPEQVVGSMGKLEFRMVDGKPVLTRLPQVDHVDDGPGKPVGIQKFIGRRPIAAFGNSDGDLQMLQYVAGGTGPNLALLLHHTDGERETAYDRASSVGRIDKALDEAKTRNWVVVDMKQDWNKVFPFQ
jgi:haloacid dehalogenase-like hydrolase